MNCTGILEAPTFEKSGSLTTETSIRPSREVRELRQANEILRKASAYFAAAELDRPFKK